MRRSSTSPVSKVRLRTQILSVSLRIVNCPVAGAPSQGWRCVRISRSSACRPYDGRTIPLAVLRRLGVASRRDGVGFHLFTDSEGIEPLIELVEEGNRVQFGDPAFVKELIAWIRFNGREIENRQDGLTHTAMGLPPIPRWLGRLMMKTVATPRSQARSAARAIRSSAAMMLFTADRDDPRGWVDLGRSFERVALTATTLDIRQAS